MKRPYIFCHMLMSLDGKITGDFMDTDQADAGNQEYERVNRIYAPQAWVNGRITIDENFTFYRKPDLEEPVTIYPHDDFVADVPEQSFIVAIDASGKLGWEKNYVEYAGRPKAYVIEALTNRVSDAYLSFLRKRNISYVFAGDNDLSCTLLVQKLHSLFGIEKLKLSGGGTINWSFLQEGIVDELSLIIAPVVDGAIDTPTLFERSAQIFKSVPIAFTLKSVEAVSGGCLWARYIVKNDSSSELVQPVNFIGG